MADRKAVNRYYPPDFDPTKHGSINKYRNSHPLRERAKRLSEGILVIRFEMPYNIWCGGCGSHIGMGVRYNADKTKVGNYYTTPIYRFRMKCHLCDNYFEMETNPMKCDYTIVTGAQRKNQKWDMAENEQVLTEDRQTVKKLASDPMFKLEHGVDDTKKLEAVAPTLHELEKTQTTWKDDFEQNRRLRKKFRMEKNELKSAMARDQSLLTKSSLDIQLVPEHEDDKKLASLMKYNAVETYDEKQKKKRQEISNQSIFSSKCSSSSPKPKYSGTPKSPQDDASKEIKISEVQIRLGLIDKLKASKRSRTGFDDFGSDSQRKVPCQSNRGIGIIVSKKERKTSCEERLKSCSDNGEESQHRAANVDDELRSMALRVGLGLDDCSGRVSEGNRLTEENDLRCQGLDKERTSQDSDSMQKSEGRDRENNPSRRTESIDCGVQQASVDTKRLSQEPLVRLQVSPLASDNSSDGQQSKSLVSFDYSSSDSDN